LFPVVQWSLELQMTRKHVSERTMRKAKFLEKNC
ncbi:MAG: hypothetical protein ACI84C_002699, partial [Flavobacteriales bacterium]